MIEEQINLKKNHEREFSGEEKNNLAEAWVSIIVDNTEPPPNIENMDNEQLKNWLFKVVMEDIERLADELGLKPNEELIEKIKEEDNTEEKAKLEWEYIKDSHAQVDNLVKDFDRSGNKGTKWDSWPKEIRETKHFNCTGATQLGMYFLEKAGITSFISNPASHVVNIAQLSNQDVFYVDYRNGEDQIIKLDTEQIEIAGAKIFEVENNNVDYRYIPIWKNSNIARSILGNLISILETIEQDKERDSHADRKEAKASLEKHKEHFNKIDFSKFHEELYPEMMALGKSDEFRKEKARVRELDIFRKKSMDFLKTLGEEEEKALTEDMKKNKDIIAEILNTDNQKLLKHLQANTVKFIVLFFKETKNLKKNFPTYYKEEVNKIINRLNNL